MLSQKAKTLISIIIYCLLIVVTAVSGFWSLTIVFALLVAYNVWYFIKKASPYKNPIYTSLKDMNKKDEHDNKHYYAEYLNDVNEKFNDDDIDEELRKCEEDD